jgi:signal transduction histidine kinase
VVEPIPPVEVDASRVEIILGNLLRNAASYADPAHPVRWVRVRFSWQEDAALWWMEVSDNGLGIPTEHHGRIFERFFRAHPERAEGTGLGLAIVQDAVRQLGGRIELESEPGVGTTFRIALPRGGVEE